MPSAQPTNSYRFGFILTVSAGNRTRYLNLRKYAERDPQVECVWAPIEHHLDPDPFRFLPEPVRVRSEVMWEARNVIKRFGDLDAVMFHAFEPYVAAVFASYAPRTPLVVWSQDNPPSSDPSVQFSGSRQNPVWRRKIRFHFDRWCARRVSLFIPFGEWAGEVLRRDCKVDSAKIAPINVGLDLEQWPRKPMPENPRPQILFVGGNFVRKGGDVLLQAFEDGLASKADLQLVTKEPPPNLPPSAHVYTDLSPNDSRLRELYARADVLVLPTRADLSPWVIIEAMATGRPVIASRTGGIPDSVVDGESGFLIDPANARELGDRLHLLLSDLELRRRMGDEGRRIVERKFDASRNVPRILDTMKAAVDSRLGPSARSAR